MPNSEAALQVLPDGIELNRQTGEVHKQGLKITLPEQLFRLLALLAERPGEVVTREEIRKSLWSNSFVNFDDSINSAIKRLRQSLDGTAGPGQMIETLPGHGYRLVAPTNGGYANSLFREAARVSAKPHLAALPFDNLSGNPSEEYLADSMTDAVITALAKIPALYVKPRCSVMKYKQLRRALAAMGKRLQVDVVLQGAIVHVEGRLRVTAQLLSVATEEHLWAESYDCDSHNILGFQTEVAEKIAAQVADKLVPPWKRRLSHIAPLPVAHDAHLKAHQTFRSFTNDGFWKARQYWKKAVHEDPSYAQAYAGLAESYNMLGMTGLLDTIDALGEAREAATRAVEMDESLGEAHAALAHTYAVEWNWAAASHEFNQALRLDPNMMTGNPCHYAEFLMATTEQEEAIREIERLRAARPLSSFLSITLGWAHYGFRDYERAVRTHQEVLKNDPKYALGHVLLGLDYAQKKRYKTAIEHYRKALSIAETRLALNALGFTCGIAGDKESTKEVLNELKRLLRTSFSSPYALAAIYAGLGEREAAFDYLGRAFERRDPELIWLRWDPQLDNLRSDPRFQTLLNRMGLEGSPTPSKGESFQ